MNIIKLLIIKIVPAFVLGELMSILPKLKDKKITILYQTKKIFKKASEIPAWLGWNDLERLQGEYPLRPPYGYDPETLQNRGEERAEEILSLIPTKTERINTFLELGCWDGMVSCNLNCRGKKTTAIDNRTEGFDQRAINEGVALLQMDSTHLKFENESFDFVFSYDAFEHFEEPELVLQEAIRVVKKGGYIYLSFGPLYMSSDGLHLYNIIPVPYCQFLFSKELLKDFVKSKGLKPLLFERDHIVSETQINGWSLDDYRSLWCNYSHKLKKIKYHEKFDLSHLDLIQKYPSCFKSKTKFFDNFIISQMEVLFKRIS
ncbi:MAG: class I SAM-dependent methyltransferase [Candidatus Scalindua sp.]